MFFTKHRQLLRWLIIIASFAIISLILWNTYSFFQKFKAEERIKMETWSYAQKEINKSQDLDANLGELPLAIITSNTTTPMLLVDTHGHVLTSNNIKEEKLKDTSQIKQLIKNFSAENSPIEITFQSKVINTLYYGNSPILNKLKYYPLALLLIIVLFGAVVYFFYTSNKNATQNKLWSGMAKETAHQIGTPLSSLIGWAELLKTEKIDPSYIVEIEKDIDRLITITERFSNIGSLPILQESNIVKETENSYTYLKTRSSKLVNFNIEAPNYPILVNLCPQLYSWTIENLVKNGIDAMKGKGSLTIKIYQQDNKNVVINVIDTGKGLLKNDFNTIFEPGYTSKKRGWGLGLSLAKRIVEDFHDGKIRVSQSEIDKGTTMQIVLKTI